MIIVRTPLRVSFFGGGTDHPSWFKTGSPGAVLSTTIDKYVFVNIRHLPPIFDFKYRVVWRMVEQCSQIADIVHPVVREVLRHYGPNPCPGFEIVYHADLPARTGLGSSSAFTVAALHALAGHAGQAPTKMSLAMEAIRVEQEHLREPVGSQDQTAVAFGGLNRIDFKRDGSLVVDPIDISIKRKSRLNDHMILFFTGFTRDAGAIEKDKVALFAYRTAEMHRLYELVGQGQAILENSTASLEDFGSLLDEAWQRKRALSPGVSSERVDAVYAAALRAGALGGKLLGAGGGGFMLFFAAPERHEAVKRAISGVELERGRCGICIPMRMEDSGSSIILNNPEYNVNFRLADLTEAAA